MSDAFDPNVQPPPDQGSQQPTMAPPELNPFNPFPRSPQDLRFWNLAPDRPSSWQLASNAPVSPPAADSQNFMGNNQQTASLEPTVPPSKAPQPPPQPPPQQARPELPQQGKPPPRTPPQWVPNRRQFYNPLLPNRGPGGWGTARQFPMLPPIWQVPDVFMGLGRDFGMMGPPMLAMIGLGLGRYVKAFMDGLHRGQREFAKQHKQRAKHAAKDLDQRSQQMLDEYRQAFAGSSGPQDQAALEQKIADVARRYGDNKMLGSLQNNGIQGTIQMLNWIDAKHGDLKAAMRADDEHDAQLANLNPFTTDPVDSLGMPVTREPPPFATAPTRLAGELPTPDTSDDEDSSDPDDEDESNKEWEEQERRRQEELRQPQTRDPGPVYKGEQNAPAEAGAPFQHLPFDPAARPEQKQDPYDPQRGPTTGDKPVPIPLSKDPAQTYPPGTRTLAQPIQTAQADTGTATDAPSPAETATADDTGAATDIWDRVRLHGQLKELKDTQARAEREKEEKIANDEAQGPLEMTPALAATKRKNPNADLRMIDGLAKRKFLGQISASELKDLSKRGLADDVDTRELELERSVEDILGRARGGQLPHDQVMNEINKKLGPRMAGEVQAIIDGLGSSRANLKMPPYDKLIPLAKAVDPNLTDASLAARKTTMGYWLGRTGTQIIARGVHAMEVGADLQKTLANQPNYFEIKAWEALHRVNARAAAKAFPEVSKWMGDLEAGSATMVSESQYVFAAGNPTMAERKLMKEGIDWNDPVHAVEQIKKFNQYLQWRMEDNRRLFKAGTAGMPNSDQIFSDMLGPMGKKWSEIPAGTKSLDELEGGETGAPAPGGDFQDVPGMPGVKFRQVK